MRTIGPRLPTFRPRDDYVSQCQDCGSRRYRSQLSYNGDGRLLCPDCWTAGASDLAAENAAGAERYAAALARPRSVDSRLFPDGDAEVDPAVTFGDVGVALDLNATMIAAEDGEALASIQAGAASLVAGLGPATFVALDPTLKAPAVEFSGAFSQLIASGLVLQAPFAYWCVYCNVVGGNRFLTSYRPIGMTGRAQLTRNGATGELTMSSDTDDTGELTARAAPLGEWSRFLGVFAGDATSFLVGRSRATGDVGSEPLDGLSIRSTSSTTFRIHRLLVLGGAPSSEALRAADSWVQQTFEGRVRA